MNFEYLSLVAVLVILIFFALVVIKLKSKPGRGDLQLCKAELMTSNELEFWRLLVPAAAPLNVAPQVAMGALISTRKGLSKSELFAARNRFDRKRVDFILYDEQGTVRLLIELDDRTHETENDAKRDLMTASVGYQTLRVRRKDARTEEALKIGLAEAMAGGENTVTKLAVVPG